MTLDAFERVLPAMPHDGRWELIEGRFVQGSAGESWEHNVISQNIAQGLRRLLRARKAPCHIFRETFYLKNRSIESATLPDAMVSCGALHAGMTSVDDPVILVEVVSPDSAERDRVAKWRAYRRLPSLRHFALVDGKSARVEVFDRAGATWAGKRTLDGLHAVLALPALGLSLPLADIFEDVLPT